MFKGLRSTTSALCAAVVLAVAGCGGGAPSATDDGRSLRLAEVTDGTTPLLTSTTDPLGRRSLSTVAAEPAGSACPNGGSRVASGLDTNGNGLLDAGEVSATRLVCQNKAALAVATGASSLISASSEPPGARCAAGGTRIDTGLDANGNGLLDGAEVAATRYLCHSGAGSVGLNSLAALAAEPAGAACAAGGSRITSGLDSNRNGVLDAGEVSATQVVCHGAAGASGAPGASAAVSRVRVSSEAAGAQCAAGGSRIDAGLDANGNGTLDDTEVASTSYACNGSNGGVGAAGSSGSSSLIAVLGEPAGAHCAAGGTRVLAGLDGNGNGTLDSAEVTGTAFICNGAAGAGLGWTALSAGPVQAVANQGYVAQSSSGALLVTLPGSPAVGDMVRIVGAGQGGWRLAQNAGQWVDTQRLGADALDRGSLGVDWVLQDPGIALRCNSMATSQDGTTVLRGSSTSNRMRLTVNGGATWDYGAGINPNATNGATTAVSRDGLRMVVADGGGGLTGVLGNLYTSRDGGLSWQPGTLQKAWSAAALSADGGSLLLADLGLTAAGGQLYLSTDFGVTFTAVGPSKPWRRAVMSADGRHIAALAWSSSSDAQEMFTSSDRGLTWTQRLPGQPLSGLAMTADGSQLAVASMSLPGGAPGALLLSNDGGASWVQRGASASWRGLAMSADGNTLMAMAAGNSVHWSTDGGISWAVNTSLLINSAVTIFSPGAIDADGSHLMVCTTNGLYQSRARGWSAGTTAGTAGALSGGRYTAADLQYQGNGRWLVVSHIGSLFVQ